MTYGERIRRGREAKALTQEELAEALGVSRQAVSKWEGDLSRPAAGKLALLSETLDIPWDAWQAMDAEEAAAQAAARETEGERRARKWRRGFAALAALLGLSLLINVLLWAKLHPAEDGPAGETSPIAAFPETLTVRVSRDYRFGDETPEEDPRNPWQIPFLKDDLALQEHELLAAYFEDINALGQHFLSVVKANPRQEQDFTLWNIYVIWATADERGDLDYRILYQAACDISTPSQVSWQRFENVLGHSGTSPWARAAPPTTTSSWGRTACRKCWPLWAAAAAVSRSTTWTRMGSTRSSAPAASASGRSTTRWKARTGRISTRSAPRPAASPPCTSPRRKAASLWRTSTPRPGRRGPS